MNTTLEYQLPRASGIMAFSLRMCCEVVEGGEGKVYGKSGEDRLTEMSIIKVHSPLGYYILVGG